MIEIKKVVVIGANGTMGAGSGEVFAAGGCDVVFLARSHEKAHEALQAAQNMAKSQRIGDRISVGTYQDDLEDAVAKGGKVMVGGKKLQGQFFQPTVIAEATSDMLCAREETFGPLETVFRFKTEQEAIAAANNNEF